MSEIGEPSMNGEEVPRDLHVVHEELKVSEPITESVAEESEPEEEPFEVEDEGDELEGFSDGPIPEENSLLGELVDKNQELEDRVQELEEENDTQQYMVNQYKDLVHYLLARNVELGGLLHQSEHLVDTVQVERDTAIMHWKEETTERVRLGRQWDEAVDRIHDLENEVRGKNAKMDKMSFAFSTAIGRWQSRIHHYPVEEGQSSRMVSRKRAIRMGDEEYQEAKQRGMLWQH